MGGGVAFRIYDGMVPDRREPDAGATKASTFEDGPSSAVEEPGTAAWNES